MLDSLLRDVFTQHWYVLAFTAALFFASVEAGYRLGHRLFREHDESRKGQIGGIQGAVLGLLALLLAFTFSMSMTHYESRRAMILEEANAIGTTFLRTAVLPQPRREKLEDLLRKYTDSRIALYEAGENRAALDELNRAAAQLQTQMWNEATAAALEAPGPISALYLTALNQTIDLDAARRNAMRNSVPGAVWLLVFIVGAVGCYITAYAAGASGKRNHFANILLPLLLAVVTSLVADLDRPRGGLIQIKLDPMRELKASITP